MRRWTAATTVFLAFSGCLVLTGHDDPWPCSSQDECQNGFTCRRLTAAQGPACVDPSACVGDADCSGFGPGWSCVDRTCQPPGCTDDSTCGAFRCVGYACATACSDDTLCRRGYRCESGQCVHATCKDAAPGQCAGYACKAGMCATECAVRADCDPGEACVGGQCVCDGSPGHCPGHFRCVGASCLTACGYDGQCDPGFLCDSGKCVQCVGTPFVCRNLESCDSPGCSMHPACVGNLFSCHRYDHSDLDCLFTKGCTWNKAAISCSGVASCADQSLSLCTDNHPDCMEGTACLGTPPACEGLSVAVCPTVHGCTLR